MFHLFVRVYLVRLHFGNQVVQLVRIGFAGQQRGLVVPGEGFDDIVRIVEKVQHEGIVLLWARPVQTAERLHRLDVVEHLVYIHGVQQRLVIAGLEHVRHDEKTIRVLLEGLGDGRICKAIQARGGYGRLIFVQLFLAREGDDRLVGAASVGQTLVHCMVIVDAPLDAAGDNHGSGLTADLPLGNDLLMKVADHHVRLFGNGERDVYKRQGYSLLN